MNWPALAITVVVGGFLALFIWLCVTRRWSLSRFLPPWTLSSPQADIERNRYEKGNIALSADGFAVRRHGKLLADVKWDSVEEIVAYKADLFAYDMICWEVTFEPGPETFEVNEHMVGFSELQKAAEARFAIPESWWSTVAFPAFVPNPTILWRRGEGPIMRAIPPPRGEGV
jgi:hypothetical protein